MEEKKNQVLSNEVALDQWVRTITDQVKAVQEGLNKLSYFESEIQKVEWSRQLSATFFDYSCFEITRALKIVFWVQVQLCHSHRYHIENIKDFLVAKGFDWHRTALKVSEELGTILPKAQKIRRNILYPEVAEMEKNLAEKEKEIAGLHDAIEKAIIALDQTKKIFKSPTIGRIRQDLIEALPYGKSKKFISGFTLRIKQIEEEKSRSYQPPEPSKFRELDLGVVQKGGVNDPPTGPRPSTPPPPQRPSK